MTIAVGDKIPSVTIKDVNMQDVSTSELFAGKKAVLFAVPGAFTPTCSNNHLPGFVEKAGDLKAKGVDLIACVSVNDAFVMKAWGEDRGTGDAIVMLADGNGDLAKAMGLEMDGKAIGFGLRSQRYAAIIDDGVVTDHKTFTERPNTIEVARAVVSNLIVQLERLNGGR